MFTAQPWVCYKEWPDRDLGTQCGAKLCVSFSCMLAHIDARWVWCEDLLEGVEMSGMSLQNRVGIPSAQVDQFDAALSLRPPYVPVPHSSLCVPNVPVTLSLCTLLMCLSRSPCVLSLCACAALLLVCLCRAPPCVPVPRSSLCACAALLFVCLCRSLSA